MSTTLKPSTSTSTPKQSNGNEIQCTTCFKHFSNQSNYRAHMKKIHNIIIPSTRSTLSRDFLCSTCGAQFHHARHLYRHRRNIHNEDTTKQKKTTPASSESKRSKQSDHSHQNTSKEFTCRVCDKHFTSLKLLQQHWNTKQHVTTSYSSTLTLPTFQPQTPSISSNTVEEFVEEPIDNTFMENELDKIIENDTFKEEYSVNWSCIRSHYRMGDVHAVFNVRWISLAPPNWSSTLLPILHLKKTKFKINFSHSFILRHIETGEFRYFHASANNNSVLQYPKLINNEYEFKDFIQNMNEDDPLEFARQSRPDTKWTVQAIVATSFYLWFLLVHPLD